jgi:hypothetical protein
MAFRPYHRFKKQSFSPLRVTVFKQIKQWRKKEKKKQQMNKKKRNG